MKDTREIRITPEDFYDFNFLDVRVGILESILTKNPEFRKLYIEAYEQLREDALNNFVYEKEAFIERIDLQLDKLTEEDKKRI
ncbi:hypothetical protein [Capnocytophaga canis]|uniref:hypothetical protein n=1 Tax=Capnocytophaga canis TaxID=1848903 RepID=UPI0037D4DB66